MNTDGTTEAKISDSEPAATGATEFGLLLAQLHESDVAMRAAHLGAERAQDRSLREIATALQDDVDQAIRTATAILHTLRTELADDPRARTVTRIEDQLARAAGRLQRLIVEVRPPLLERLGLAATLRTFLEGVRTETGLDFELIDGLTAEPPTETQINLFRIAHEAVDNVRKYARAKSVRVEVRTYAGGFLVRVTDDGEGFEQAAAPVNERLGFLMMSQRAELRDGWWQANSTPGEGTTVEVWTPGEFRTIPRGGAGEATFLVE